MAKTVIKSKRGAAKASAQLRANIDKAIGAAKDGVHESLREDVRRIFNISQDLVPVDTGALKASGNWEGSFTPELTEFRLSYHTKYAAYIHERTDLNHPATGPKKRNPSLRSPTPQGQRGQAKYLSEAANIVQSDIPRNAADGARNKINSAMGGGSNG